MSPLGVIPRKVQGEFIMIHHMSVPFGGSAYDSIPPEFCSVQYAAVDDAGQTIKRTDCALAKTDVRSAFRTIPVHTVYSQQV